ncbi:ribonuclease HII [Anaerococcus sp. mt242]|uniref:ribonuclease HII n=1 Tax=Anaerococcus sp. mt242 TaxID=2661917 RepID=UPI001931681A|nr:ribonuclease HII [Anaerococcus sp. mt242]MBM0046648.1 ribonuclease HII [Anaerococcus sp. mt242]
MRYSEYNDQIKKQIYEKYTYIAGVDEVGRGPLAGPVVTCAVIMKKDSNIEGVTDSKKLKRKKMLELKEQILDDALAVSYGYANNKVIDKINIRQATLFAMKNAVENLNIKPEILLIDAERIDSNIPQLNIVKGDLNEYAISCASILAKIRRDDIMINFSKIYPEYSFDTNVGYGTKKHYEAIDNNGITPIHRLSFLKKYYAKQESFL